MNTQDPLRHRRFLRALLQTLALSTLLFACSVEAPPPKGTGGATSSPPRDDHTAEDDDAPRVLDLTTDLPAATINVPYAAALPARKSIGKVQFELSSGSLPPGLTLSETGEISGTPTELGEYELGVAAEDFHGAKGKASLELSVTRKRWVVYEARATDSEETKVFAVDLVTPGLSTHELVPEDGEYETFSLSPREVVWSDDGRLVAFLGASTAETALFVVDMSGAEPGAGRRLAAGPSITVHGWAPGATRLAYSLDDTRRLFTVDAADPDDTPQNHGTGDAASWATAEFLVCENEDAGIFTVRFDETGHGETRATDLDERHVVAQSSRSQLLITRVTPGYPDRYDSILFDLKTGPPYPILVDATYAFVHASPNFRFAAHPSDDGWGLAELLTATRYEVPTAPISDLAPGVAAHWSPDSQWVVLDGPAGQIARLDDTTSTEDPTSFHPIGGEDGSLELPSFSPDSRWLQFQKPLSGSLTGDDYEPAVGYLVALDDEPLAPTPLLQEPDGEPAFSPNSRYFALASYRENVDRTEISLVDLGGALEPVQVTHADIVAGNSINDITFTADSLALVYATSASGAFLVSTTEIDAGARPQRLTRLTVNALAPQK